MSGKDPFSGYDLPEEPASRKPRQPAKSSPKKPDRPRKQERWDATIFEVGPRPGYVNCHNCFHYISGGELTVDGIPEARRADSVKVLGVVGECRTFDRDFEAYELQEVTDNTRTMTESYAKRPRVRGYCAADSLGAVASFLIPEIKNADGLCSSFLPGRRPKARCENCTKMFNSYVSPPERPDFRSQTRSSTSILSDMIGPRSDLARRVLSDMRNMYDRGESDYRIAKEEYEQKLINDITDVSINDRGPRGGTVASCNETFRGCAATNRGNCPHFHPEKLDQLNAARERHRNQPKADKPARSELGLSGFRIPPAGARGLLSGLLDSGDNSLFRRNPPRVPRSGSGSGLPDFLRQIGGTEEDSDVAPPGQFPDLWQRILRGPSLQGGAIPESAEPTAASAPSFTCAEQRFFQNTAGMDPQGPSDRNKYRWEAFQAIDSDFATTVERTQKSCEKARTDWEQTLADWREGAGPDALPQCFRCKHMRFPLDVNPFETVHFNSQKIMEMRNTFQREKAHRVAEERRLARHPGPTLGTAEPPALHVWCDAYSTKDKSDGMLEYALCSRVLDNLAKDGGCPGFSPIA
jgi:hypothetical protein